MSFHFSVIFFHFLSCSSHLNVLRLYQESVASYQEKPLFSMAGCKFFAQLECAVRKTKSANRISISTPGKMRNQALQLASKTKKVKSQIDPVQHHQSEKLPFCMVRCFFLVQLEYALGINEGAPRIQSARRIWFTRATGTRVITLENQCFQILTAGLLL